VKDQVREFLIGRIAELQTEEGRTRVLQELELAGRNLTPEDFEGMEWVLDQIQVVENSELTVRGI